MSDSVPRNNEVAVTEPKDMSELTQYVTLLLQQMQDRFQSMSDQIIGRIDEMGNRIDDLEKNINDLLLQTDEPQDK